MESNEEVNKEVRLNEGEPDRSLPAEESFTADALAPLFQGRSVNSRFFTIACLLHAKLLRRTENGYARETPAELWTELLGLIQAGTNLLPASMDKGAGPMVVTIPKATKKASKKVATLATA